MNGTESFFVDGPSAHLSWSELACRDGTPYPDQWRVSRARPLALCFEEVRQYIDAPIQILSGYRTKSHNRKHGGARKSQHVHGRGLDMATPDGWSFDFFLWHILSVANRPGSLLRGIGVYPWWGVHIDTRPGTRLARWRGERVSAELGVRV